jgi:multiple sugar transport system substrate-binding protein
MKASISTIVLWALIVLWVLPHNAVFGQGVEATSKPFAGVEVNVLTMDASQIVEPLRRRGLEFLTLSGATINVTVVPFSDLYSEILTDLAGTRQYDAYVFVPQWLVDYVETGNLQDLTARVAADTALEWDDVAPFFRNYHTTYGGRIYTMPLDGDFMMVYYRHDLLHAEGLPPPATWEAYLTVAQRFQGLDLNGDGNADFGSCIPKHMQTLYWFFFAIATPYIQSLGTGQGAFFDTQTIEPLVDNEALAAALDVFKQSGQWGPPNEQDLYVGDTRDMFLNGRCALTVDWGDTGTLAIDRYVQERLGAIILPGSTRVLDRSTGKLVACNTYTCPYAINGVNHAPFAATGGWSGAINATADARVKDAAYAFLSYMSQPAQSGEDVTRGVTGFNPYRVSHFENLQPWLDAGMSLPLADNYLSAIRESLESPNIVLDLRLPGTHRYQQEVSQAVRDFLSGGAGQAVADQAVSQFVRDSTNKAGSGYTQQIHNGWEQITNEIGRDAQLRRYRKCLQGAPPKLFLPVIRGQR